MENCRVLVLLALIGSLCAVHSLTPADVAAVFSLGSPPARREESARVIQRLAELLSMFNPEVTAEMPLQPRSVPDEAAESHQAPDWNLAFVFAPADRACPCSTHVSAELSDTVQQVDAALQLLQKRLPRTLVHVVVWSSSLPREETCQCTRQENRNQRLLRALLLKRLQDSLSALVEDPKWISEDFAVVLQSEPLVLDPGAETDQLALQLWTNLLQPQAAGSETEADPIPCPSQERPFLRTRTNTPPLRHDRATSVIDPIMGSEIPCTNRQPSPVTPTSVHELRPGDIKVVAAVGDSLTAANGVGAKNDNLLLVINEYRGLSWSIGGDGNISTVTTLPNILKEFNPNVTGYAEGICKQGDPEAFLNQAVAGAKSGDMVEQVRTLVEKMRNDPRIDFHNDWKVITMFVGGNDICDFCTDSLYFSPRNVVERIRQALDLLHSEVPRAVVNLIELLNIVPLRDLHKDKSLGCPTWFVSLVCPCILKPLGGSQELQTVDDFNKAYQHAMRTLVDSGRYDTHHNFTVVLQPFFREVFLPLTEDGRPDRTFFTPDCFHLSQRAHTLMAKALWNNMLEPVGNKTFTQDFMAGIDLKCPSEEAPFIRTAFNSNYTFPGPPPTAPPVTNWGSDFSCADTAPSDSVPTSAHRVRPADIKVVAALGDSITAGFGAKAKSLLQLRTEYRGVSWSIGGDKTLETVTTLPNILKKFNPDIKGASKGTGKRKTGFNMSVSGAKVAGIPGQVRALIDAMRSDPTVDFDNDWKLVTLFIGGNDLCQYCNDRASMSPRNYSQHMQSGLDMLYEEVPRTIVNVLQILEVEGLRRIKRDSLGCSLLQKLVCPCFLLPSEDSPQLAEIKRINRDLQIETEKLVNGGRYDRREDFAVVLQPFFKNTVVPLNLVRTSPSLSRWCSNLPFVQDARPDVTYFSEDCFHFSERGHADMAAAIWNNMLEPEGQKKTYNEFRNSRGQLRCPTKEHPYIFTRRNSLPSVAPSTTPPAVNTAPLPTSGSGHSTSETLTPGCSDVPVWLAAVLPVSAEE
ncbi:phospholipase B1, membrane-associated-like [Neosynchiropus ocellatus]